MAVLVGSVESGGDYSYPVDLPTGECRRHDATRIDTVDINASFIRGRREGPPKMPNLSQGRMMAKAQKKRVRKRRDMVSPFRNKIWDLFAKEAKGMDGADVVLALRQAGEEIWAVGIDDIYSGMPNQNDEALGNAFDITWLTIVCIKLAEIKNGHRPQVKLRVKAQNKSGT